MRHAILLAVTAFAAACAAGCVTNPRPPPFSEAQATRVLGCAQLGFRTWADDRVPATSLVLQVSLRNRCLAPTPVDWSALRIVAVGPDGDHTEATLYDPRGEVVPLRIDSETEASELLRIDLPTTPDRVRALCIDVSHVSPDAEQAATAPACIATPQVPDDESEGEGSS